jgi:hypothetical protein
MLLHGGESAGVDDRRNGRLDDFRLRFAFACLEAFCVEWRPT